MEQKSSPLVKSSITYGIYLGLISILLSVVIWAGGLIESMGLMGITVIGLVSLVLSFVVLLVFAKSYRNKELGGYISFLEALKFTLLVVVVSTVIITLYNVVFHMYIAPDYMENLMVVLQQKSLAYFEKIGASEAVINKTLEKFEHIPSIAETIRKNVLNGVIAGAIIALIVSAIVKKSDEDAILED